MNLTFVSTGDSHWQVHGTPLFVGAFPIVVPPPVDPAALDDPMTWQQGQSLGLDLTQRMKNFWRAVPADERHAAWRAPETFPQRQPFVNETPTSAMLITLEITPDIGLIEQGPHLTTTTAEMPAAARRRLGEFCGDVLSILHPAVAAAYRRRLDEALHAGKVVATWAGGDLTDPGSQHFTSITLGPFLMELLQTPQYSVSNTHVPWSNHLHVMLRDLESPVWGDPLGAHLDHDHA